MKKFILTLALSFGALLSVSAMSYGQARDEARFLTDKMAYELNLNEQQYNDCFEINLDYLLSVRTADDVYGTSLAFRNADLRHILLDWQYVLFAATDYFLHPLLWHRGAWVFPVYRHYHAGHFFYDHPHVFWSYRGGHSHVYHAGSFYADRRPRVWTGGFRGADRGAVSHRGAPRPDLGGGRPAGGGQGRGGSGFHFERPGSQPGGTPGREPAGAGRGSVSPGSQPGSQDHRSGAATPVSGYQHPSSTRTTVHAGSASSAREGGFGGVQRGGGSSRSVGTSSRSIGTSSRGIGTTSRSARGGVSSARGGRR